MKYRKVFPILVAGALAIAGLFGVVAYRSANAQSSTPTVPNGAQPGQPPPQVGGRGFDHGYNNDDLANALGITVDELTAAVQKANAAALDQAVKAGLITQAQADEMNANGAAFPFGDHGSGWQSQNGIDYDALLADALGISVDRLQAAYTQAYNARIDQAVADGTLTQAQADLMKGQYALNNDKNYQSAMQSAFESAVKQAVTDGVISQAQADQILQNSNGLGFKGMGGLGEFGGGPGGDFGGRGGHGPGGPGRDMPNGQAPAAPTATPSSGT
jgi:hypothetical protein